MIIHSVGGYEEIGKNMTAVEIDGDVVIVDMGADLETVIESPQSFEHLSTTEAVEMGAVPDDSTLFNRREDVVGIVITHGHLDHCLAVPKLAVAYDCPIFATPYTQKVIERLVESDDQWINNDYHTVESGNTVPVTDTIELEFVQNTHSIPQAPITAIHSPSRTAVISTDFRLDDDPVIGESPDYERLRELGRNGVDIYLGESTRVDQPGESRSETKIRQELNDELRDIEQSGQNPIVSTFSSHIGRLKSIIEANSNRRQIAFLGRSLKEYTTDAAKVGLFNSRQVVSKGSFEEIDRFLKRIDPRNWLIVCTGHQGEENAVLTRISHGAHDYPLSTTRVVFSSSVIPTDVNERQYNSLTDRLEKKGAELTEGLHAHGHAKQDEHRQMLRMLSPTVCIPTHGTEEKKQYLHDIANNQGIDTEDLQNGETFRY